MTGWLWSFVMVGWISVMALSFAEAKDRSVAKSLSSMGPVIQGGYARSCRGGDLLGNWRLVTFDSPYRFRNPQAPYLFPHQVFQYSNRGAAKSAHSHRPIAGLPDTVFGTVPLEMTYRVEQGDVIVLKKNGPDQTVENWTCKVVTQDHEEGGGRISVKRGDVWLTLRGAEGQTLFVRHLRKAGA